MTNRLAVLNPKSTFRKDFNCTEADYQLRHNGKRHRPNGVFRQPNSGVLNHVVEEADVKGGGYKGVDGEFGNVLFRRVHRRKGDVHHTNKTGEANTAKDPHAGFNAIGWDREPVANRPLA